MLIDGTKAAQEATDKVSRRLNSFSQCSDLFLQAASELELLQSACEIAATGDDLSLAWIGYCEDNAERLVRPVAKAGPSLNRMDRVKFSWRTEEVAQNPIEVALRSRKPCWVNDIAADMRFPVWRNGALEAGHSSCLALPLIALSQRQGDIDLRGSLHLCSAEPGFFDESAIEYYSRVATCLTFAVAALRSTLADGITSAVATLRANRERKLAQDKLQMMREEVARVARLGELGQMVASIAHEIRQPLGAIAINADTGLLSLAQSSPDLDEVRTLLNDIAQDGRRANEVITGIRSMFMKGEQAKELHDINEVAREVLMLVRPELESLGISVRINFAEELPRVLANRIQMQQVILNLVKNAIEAMTSQTDRERALRLRSDTLDSNSVVVMVEDTGPGIDKDNVKSIFDPFYTTKAYGTGLGLAICQSIVQAHDGQLWTSPGHPRGTAFHLVLPRAPL